MNFGESVKYLYGLGNEVLAMKLGLANITALLNALGDPHLLYFKIQVAGTNGKGSTCAFLDAICRDAGIKTGVTTSPHLISVTERVRIDGRDIAEEDFARLATIVRQTAEKLVEVGKLETVPTYFEQVTAIALLAFADAGIELAILETGLGGRFDATTAACADIVAITPVDLDHERILGDTLAKIASEKAAIIRNDTPVVVAPQKHEALDTILAKCAVEGVEPILIDEDYKVHASRDGFSFDFETPKAAYERVKLGLAGRHQAQNAITAATLAELLSDNGFVVSKDSIERGLGAAKHRGRLESIGRHLYDGAHNAAGARALRAFLDEFVPAPITIVFGAMRDKDLTEIAAAIFPRADRLILTTVGNARSMTFDELREFSKTNPHASKAEVYESVAVALAAAAETEGTICVTGSLYLVGEATALATAR